MGERRGGNVSSPNFLVLSFRSLPAPPIMKAFNFELILFGVDGGKERGEGCRRGELEGFQRLQEESFVNCLLLHFLLQSEDGGETTVGAPSRKIKEGEEGGRGGI